MGEYVYAYSTVDGCWVTEVHYDLQGGGAGGSWTDQGNPTTPPSLPQSPPIIADTICTSVTDDPFILLTGTTDTAFTAGPLNDLAILDSMRAALTTRYGTIANPLPHGSRIEVAAAIVLDSVPAQYSFHRI